MASPTKGERDPHAEAPGVLLFLHSEGGKTGAAGGMALFAFL